MALVKEWIGGFLKRHKARFDPHDWPAAPANGEALEFTEESLEFTRLWVTAFATRQVAQAEADEASMALAATPPNFRREHLPMVVAMIESRRKARGTVSGSTREAARDASKGCPFCGGEGMTTVWSEHPGPRVPETVGAYCRCSSGRWIRKAHAERSPEYLRRIPDLELVLQGVLPGWLDHPPGQAPSPARSGGAAALA